jgi:hypothetical protein
MKSEQQDTSNTLDLKQENEQLKRQNAALLEQLEHYQQQFRLLQKKMFGSSCYYLTLTFVCNNTPLRGEAMNIKKDNLPIEPVTLGELLNEEFLLPLGITKYRLAK